MTSSNLNVTSSMEVSSPLLPSVVPGLTRLASSIQPSSTVLANDVMSSLSTHLTISLLPSSPLIATPITIVTSSVVTSPPGNPGNGSTAGVAIGVLILLAVIGALITLSVLVGFLFYRVGRNAPTQSNNSSSTQQRRRGGRLFSVTSSMYARVNDRGRIRRQASRQDSQRSRVS